VGAAGDVNRDGYDDIIIGAIFADPTGLTSGASYVIYGRPTSAVDRTGIASGETLTGSDLADRLAGAGGNDTVLGNAGSDTLAGGSGSDTIRGGSGRDVLTGGQGLDSLRGGLGDDSYVVDRQGEAVEQSGQGLDTVRSSVSYSLGGNLENLVLVGTANLSGTGNGLANKLTGNAGANTLSGGAGKDLLVGGQGLDVLKGGKGDDTFLVNAAGEAREQAGEGVDTVRSSLGYTLGANLENLVLLGTAGTSGTGNGQANALTGNGGANRLDGRGGSDVLTGFGGNDRFVFSTSPSAGNVDRITDMNEAGNDTILLENGVFVALGGAGALSADAFRSNATGLASDGSDRIILETDTGEIYYDSNGSASGGTYLLLARVDAGITLTALDFLVI
jgi:Ca2+-binding RTX toxin-like protein